VAATLNKRVCLSMIVHYISWHFSLLL